MTKDRKAGKANLRAFDFERLQLLQQAQGYSTLSAFLDDLIRSTELHQAALSGAVPEQRGVSLSEESLDILEEISGKGLGKPTQPEALRLLIDAYCQGQGVELGFAHLEAFKANGPGAKRFSLSLLLLPDYKPLMAWGEGDQVRWSDEKEWNEKDVEIFEELRSTGAAVKLSKLFKELPSKGLREKLGALGLPVD